MHMVKALHMEHGGKPYFSPRGPPFRPCVIWRPAARDAFLRLPRSPRRLRQRGGLNARCHSASQNIFCDVAAFAAIPSLGPCALGTHGLAPCVRNCTGMLHLQYRLCAMCYARQQKRTCATHKSCKSRSLPAARTDGKRSPFSGDITIPPGGRQLWHRSVRLHGRPDR